ncbi:MAG: serine hydrolase domain-containing protein, partial [Gemmatimonadota bacterium]
MDGRTRLLLAMGLALATQLAASPPAAAQRLPTATPESVGMSSERLHVLDEAMQRYVDDDMVAGLVTLVARDGKIVHESALGSRYIEGGEPMPEDAIFVIMSMTKPIVST